MTCRGPSGVDGRARPVRAGGRVVPGVLPRAGGPGAGDPRRCLVTVFGDGWTYRFDTATGNASSMSVDGRELLRAGHAWTSTGRRSATSVSLVPPGRDNWHNAGLDRWRPPCRGDHRTEPDAAVVEVRSTAAAPGLADRLGVDQTMRFRIDARGTIRQPRGTGRGRALLSLTSLYNLPRVGVYLQVPDSLDRFACTAKAPRNLQRPRSGARTGVWRSTVDQDRAVLPPQAYGNHTGTGGDAERRPAPRSWWVATLT